MRHTVCSVLKINISSQDMQEIIIYKTIKKNLYCNQQRYFKWGHNHFQQQLPELLYKNAVLKFCNILRKTPVLESPSGLRLWASNFIKKRLQHRCFPVNIAKLLRTPISKNSWKMFSYKKKSLKCVIINFHVFMRKPVLQICAEQLIPGVESQIGQNNRYEIYRNMNFISFLNM